MAGFYREKGLKSRDKGWVWGVYRTPGKGREVGRSILQTLLQPGAKLEGIEQRLLSVAATETAAIVLYRSLGFQLVGCKPRALRVGDRFIDEQYRVMCVKNTRISAKSEGWGGDRKRKKRPRLCSLGRLGSPPPELPTTKWSLGS